MRWHRILVPISIGLVGLGLFINGNRAGGGLLRAIGLVVIGIAAVRFLECHVDRGTLQNVPPWLS